MTAPDGWVPAFEGQRPPFQPGNQMSVGNQGPMTHGARSSRVVDPLAEELERVLLADEAAAYLRTPRFGAAVRSWARVEAKALAVARHLDTMSIEQQITSPKPGTAPPIEVWRRLEATALTHRGRLGLDPMSAARLGKDVAAAKVDMAKLLSDAQAAADAREAGGGA